MRKIFFHLLILAQLLVSSMAIAQITVEVTGGEVAKIGLAMPEFTDDSSNSVAIVRNDLASSGKFKLYSELLQVADYAVIGKVVRQGNQAIVNVRIDDVVKKYIIKEQQFSGELNRQLAHNISDFIYQTITQKSGFFSSKITYVLKRGGRYELQVADADGHSTGVALISKQPIISPAWSPDGRSLAYVSFESNKPVIYVQNIADGSRYPLANFKGSNSSPSFAPDGKRLAIVLTKDGLSQLYMIQSNGSGVYRLHSSNSIDTEPTWSSDGQWIYFTSDRGGNPQIYRIPANGGKAERVSFEGEYNVSPALSADGKYLAYITRKGGQFNLSLQDLKTNEVSNLSETGKDESPSFAPNSEFILYANESNKGKSLQMVSINGAVRLRLSTPSGDIREPDWSWAGNQR